MKSRQFCSVCKQWLEMEVVPTGDGDDDDGVIWFRCPQCQGFLPKLSGADLQPEAPDGDKPPAGEPTMVKEESETSAEETMPWDSPAEMMAARDEDAVAATLPDVETDGADLDEVEIGDLIEPAPVVADGDAAAEESKAPPSEPIHEYAAMLAAQDTENAAPYRPWESYEIGQCIIHLAWDDCGVVVAKEDLPGGRGVIKCYFEEAGVVRLIENEPR